VKLFYRSILILIGSILVIVIVIIPKRDFWPAENSYVGKTRAEISALWGEPEDEWDGHYGNPPLVYAQKYSPAKTMVFRRWSGSLYVSMHPINGTWFCFSSTWLQRGHTF
jgi:hypothetical protein